MKKLLAVASSAALMLIASSAGVQAADSSNAATGAATSAGVGTSNVAVGWSAKRQILGKPVYNENEVRIGTITDLIIAPDSSVSYAIVSAGGFVGLGKHNVAIAIEEFETQNNKLYLVGATRDMIKELPEFEYAKTK